MRNDKEKLSLLKRRKIQRNKLFAINKFDHLHSQRWKNDTEIEAIEKQKDAIIMLYDAHWLDVKLSVVIVWYDVLNSIWLS